MSKNQKKKQELDDEFELIKQQHSGKDMDKYLVDSDEDFPDFGEVTLYDYDADIKESKEIGKELIENLVDLYLGDAKEIIKHPYIKSRMDEDAEYYSQMKTLQKLSEKLLLQQMRQIDSGDISPRMYEITTRHMSEIRENIKDGRKSKLEIEDMYKQMRSDLGLNQTLHNGESINNEDDDEDGTIIDSAKLNDAIDEMIKNKNDRNKS